MLATWIKFVIQLEVTDRRNNLFHFDGRTLQRIVKSGTGNSLFYFFSMRIRAGRRIDRMKKKKKRELKSIRKNEPDIPLYIYPIVRRQVLVTLYFQRLKRLLKRFNTVVVSLASSPRVT